MRSVGRSKKRIILSVITAGILIGLFAVALHLIENRGLTDVSFGDTGDWGDEDDSVLMTLSDQDYISYDDIDAYLIAGTDGGGVDKGKGYNGELADFITVLLIDNTTEKYAFYQIDRNSMVDVMVINESGDYTDFAHEQICTSHWYGLDEEQRNVNLANSVTDLLGGIEIDGYYVINMADIGAINDAIGGVVVDIDTDMTNLDPAFVKGSSVLLKGKQAENYLRARRDVGDGTNAARMQRQKQYMQKAYSMVISQLRENPEYVNDLYEQLSSKVQTDGTGKRMSSITRQVTEYQNMGIIAFEGKTKINDTIGEGIEHEEFYADEDSILRSLRKVMNISVDKDADSDDDAEDQDEE